MKLTVSSQDLLKKLQVVQGAINSGVTIPVLEDFLFDINNGIMTITASDLETSIITSVSVESDGNGRIAAPAKILLDTIKALPDQPLVIEKTEDNEIIELTSSYGKYKLTGQRADEYPTIQMAEGDDVVEINSDLLSQAISYTIFATSTDEMRKNMMGVCAQFDENKITFVATDAHKLSKFVVSNVKSNTTGSIIIPRKALTLLKNALPSNKMVKISYTRVNAFFEFEGTYLSCRLIDAVYPDYMTVIPVNNPLKMVINRNDLLSSLKRISIYANKTSSQIALHISNNSLTINAEDLDYSNEATEQLPCAYDNNEISIGFSSKYLIEMLSVLDSEEVKIEMSDPMHAGLFSPTDQSEDQDLLMLVMPVFIGR